MFYSNFILAKKGPLAKIWLAAHMDRRLKKNQIYETDISKSVKFIKEPLVPIALRTNGFLLLGVVKIYSRKVKYILGECNEALTKIKLQSIVEEKISLPDKSKIANFGNITLPERATEVDLMLHDLDMNAFVIPEAPSSLAMRRLDHMPMDDFDEWETAEETPSLVFSQTPSGISSVERARQEPDTSAILGEVIPIDFDAIDKSLATTMTPSTPGFVGGEMPSDIPQMTDFDQNLDISFPQQPSGIDTTSVSTRHLLPRRTGFKRGKVIEDQVTEISDQDILRYTRDTSDIVTSIEFAPSTREDIEIHRRKRRKVDEAFEEPSVSFDLPEEMLNIWRDNISTKPTAISEPIEASLMERPQMYEEEEHMFQPDVSGISFPEEEFISETPISRGRLSEVPTPMIEEEMILKDIISKSVEKRRVSERSVPSEQREEYAPTPVSRESFEIDEETRKEIVRVRKEQEQLKEAYAGKGITQQTVKVLAILKESFKDTETLSFTSMLEGRKRETAARCFYELLVIGSKDLIESKQDEPYGDIEITNKKIRV